MARCAADPMTRIRSAHRGDAVARPYRARRGRQAQDHVHDPRRRLRPRRRDEPVRRAWATPQHGCERRRRSSPTTTRAPRSGRPTRTARSASSWSPTRRSARITGARQAGSRKLDPTVTYTLKRRGLTQVDLSAERQAAGDVHRAAAGRRRRRRDRARRRRQLPRRARVRADRLQRASRSINVGRARRLPAGRRARRVARVVAGRGAEGAGDRGPHVRDHDRQERRLRPLRRHALAGLQGRRDRDRRRPTPPSPPRAGRSSPTTASRSSPTSSRPPAGATEDGREHDAGQRAEAVAEVGRGRVRQRLAAPPLDDQADDDVSAARKLGGLVQGSFKGIRVTKRGASPRIMTAEVVGSRGTTTDRRRDAARAARPVRHLGVLHRDQRREGAAPTPTATRRAARRSRRARSPSLPRAPSACCAAP